MERGLLFRLLQQMNANIFFILEIIDGKKRTTETGFGAVNWKIYISDGVRNILLW